MTKGMDKLIQLEKQGKVRIDRQHGTVEILAKNKSEERKIINSFFFSWSENLSSSNATINGRR